MLETSTHAPQPRPATQTPPRTPAEAPQTSITDTADQALQSVGALYRAVDTALHEQVQRNPYVTLGAAAGLGFVLGGGLASPMGQMLLRVSVRAFGPPLVNALLQNALQRANLAPLTEQSTTGQR